MITPASTPSGTQVILTRTLDKELKKDKVYVLQEWHGDRIVILASGIKRWVKACNFRKL